MKKYILHPGMVRLEGGQEQYFSAVELADLYKVDLQECLVSDRLSDSLRKRPELMHLYPLSKGNYREELEGFLRARGEL